MFVLKSERQQDYMTAQEFNNTIERLRPRLLHFAKGFVGDGASTADDMVQEAIIKLWKSQDLYVIRNAEALTIQILKNVCLDYLKLKKNNTAELNPNFRVYAETNPYETLESKDQLNRVKAMMEELPADQMIAVRLRDIMGYEMDEIAEILGTTEGNVRTLLSRARQKLREKLQTVWKS